MMMMMMMMTTTMMMMTMVTNDDDDDDLHKILNSLWWSVTIFFVLTVSAPNGTTTQTPQCE
jgi:hypothetical protein